ncbi:MAG: hypothetical protein ACE5H1_09920, partial [Thermodesulfobacteriota bacterium]
NLRRKPKVSPFNLIVPFSLQQGFFCHCERSEAISFLDCFVVDPETSSGQAASNDSKDTL